MFEILFEIVDKILIVICKLIHNNKLTCNAIERFIAKLINLVSIVF
jgi:hypothetical protein